MKTFKQYTHRCIFTKEGEVANGDYILSDKLIIRVKNGYLNDAEDPDGGLLPAIDYDDGMHVEHWKNGVLHMEGNDPAIFDAEDCYQEWWENGEQKETPIIPEYEE